MDGFDDAFGAEAGSGGSPPPMGDTAAAEVDPAAEFLAKEQEDLGGLGEDLGFTSAPQEVHAAQNGDMNFDFLADAEPQQGGEEPSLEDTPASLDAPELNTGVEEQSVVSDQSSVENLSQGFNNVRLRGEEPETIKKWKAEQEIRLKLKDENEEKNKEELKAKAAKELEDWYKRYDEQLHKTKETNRSEEETVVAEVNSIQPGTEWERVAKQCDFSAKNTRNTKDISRMRGILLQLKQNPPTRE
jgi:hypothetical protein